MQIHVQKVVDINQFTILVPTNSVFSSMKKHGKKHLHSHHKSTSEFIRQHVFLGILDDQEIRNKQVVYSLSSKHSLMTINRYGNKQVKLYNIRKAIRVKEGIVYIVDGM